MENPSVFDIIESITDETQKAARIEKEFGTEQNYQAAKECRFLFKPFF